MRETIENLVERIGIKDTVVLSLLSYAESKKEEDRKFFEAVKKAYGQLFKEVKDGSGETGGKAER